MDCIFCKIISKDIPAEVIFEDENVIAFLDVNPKSKGHTLVVPKKHYQNVMEKSDSTDLLQYVREVVKKLQDKYDFEDFKIIINNGAKAGQEVFHLHIHIVPAY